MSEHDYFRKISVNYGRRVESVRNGSITGFEDENR